MSIEQKLDIIISKLENIETKLNIVEQSCNGMDSHIGFINNVYNTVRSPVDFILERISYLQNGISQEYLTLQSILP